MRSTDAGATWNSLSLPVEPNTAMWVVNSQPQNPDFLLAGSRYGYLYQSEDAGASWSKFNREFSEDLIGDVVPQLSATIVRAAFPCSGTTAHDYSKQSQNPAGRT